MAANVVGATLAAIVLGCKLRDLKSQRRRSLSSTAEECENAHCDSGLRLNRKGRRRPDHHFSKPEQHAIVPVEGHGIEGIAHAGAPAL